MVMSPGQLRLHLARRHLAARGHALAQAITTAGPWAIPGEMLVPRIIRPGA